MVIIRIFVSSKTDELRAERAMIKRSLENLSDDIDVFIFEKDAGSRTDSSEVVYRTEVIDRNIYIGLFDDIYSKATEEEYHLAQNHNKESHIYIRDSPGANRDKNLKSLLKVIREKNTYSTFVSIEDLETKVRDDIMRLLITKFSVSIITTELDEFTFIGPSYFVTHQKDNFQQWKIGFPFNLVAINNGRELKRTRIVKEVIDRLDKNKLQIILARSGYSKTTILDEIICEYVSRNYKVFSIDGTIPLLNPNKTIAGIEKVLETGKQILIAVDNAHTSKIASIYYIIDRILSHNLSNNIRFILTCRLPDFEKLQKVEGTDYLEYVNKYYRSPFQYLLPAFDKQDIKEFLLKYKTASKSKFQLKTPVMKLACSLLDETNGNPMLVRFKVMNTGLKEHVNFMKNEYLKAEDDLITTIACCLLDLSEIKITDKLLKDLGLFDFAYSLDGSTMSLVGERWQTIHSNWNMELFSNLFGTPRDLGRNMKYLNGIIDKIFSIKNEDIAFAVLGTIYKMPEIGLLTFDYVESISIPNFIGDKKKASLIARLGESYHLKDQNHRALGKLDTAYSLDPNNFYVCNVFGMTLKTMREIPGAIEMFREVLRLSPESIIVNINLAEALSMNGEYPEAIAILENLIEIYSKKNDSQSLSSLYNNLGLNYYRQAQDEEAEKNYKLSLSFYEDDLPYKNLALTRFANRDFSKAIEYCDKVLELFPDDAYALEWKINSLMMEGSEEKTVKVFRKLRKIEPELYTTMKNFYRRPDWKQFFEKNYLR